MFDTPLHNDELWIDTSTDNFINPSLNIQNN